MPKKTVGRALFAEAYLARRVAMEREKRGWTYAGLAQRTKDAGCPIAASSLWKIENPPDPAKPRRIAVDELVVLSRVFNITMAELVTDPESLLPGHLAEVAERAASAHLAAYQLFQEAQETQDHAILLVQELSDGLKDRPELAKTIADQLEANHPEWVVGTEEYGMARLVAEPLRRLARGETDE